MPVALLLAGKLRGGWREYNVVFGGRKWSRPPFVKQEHTGYVVLNASKRSLKGHYSCDTQPKGWREDPSARLLLLGELRWAAAQPSDL